MAEVGRIQIEVDARQAEKAVRTLNQMGVQAQRAGRKVGGYEKQTERATRATNKMVNSSRKLTRMFGLLSAGIGGLTFIGLAREIGQATTQLNNIEATMRVAAGSSQAASRQLGFIREEAERLGLFFPAVAKQMAQFSAAARGTSITSKELRTIFTGISEASRAMGLTAPQAEGAMMALQQMMSKGKVSAEELRQQLGERMPGSIQIMAASLDVTTQQLFEMMENGELLSDEVLPKFGRELSKVFGREATQQADRLAASVDRLRNSFFDLLAQDQGLPGASSAINELAVVVGSSQFQKSFDTIVQSISEFMRVIADNLDHLIQLSKVLASIGIGLFAKRVATSSANLLTMAGSLNVANTSLRGYNALTAVAVASSNALAASISRIIWPLALVSGTVAAYKMFSDSSEEAEHKTANLRAEIEGLQKGFIDTSIASLEYQRSLARPDFSEFVRQSKELAALQNELQEAQERQEDRGFLDITFGEDSVATLKQQIRELKNRRSELEENTTFYAELTKRIEEQRDALQEAENAAEDHSEALNALANLDPVFAASQQLREELSDIDMIVEQLGISEQRTSELREDAFERYRASVREAIGLTEEFNNTYSDALSEILNPTSFKALTGLEVPPEIDEIPENFAQKFEDELEGIGQSLADAMLEGDWEGVGQSIGDIVGSQLSKTLSESIGESLGGELGQGIGQSIGTVVGTAVGGTVGAVVGQAAGSLLDNLLGDEEFDLEAVQARQNTGTVLGSIDQKSSSIDNSLQEIQGATDELVNINTGMLRSLQQLQSGISRASARVAGQRPGAGISAGIGVTQGDQAVSGTAAILGGVVGAAFDELLGDLSPLNLLKPVIKVLDDIFFNVFSSIGSALFGGDRSVVDRGVQIIGGEIGAQLDETLVRAFALIKEEGGFFSSDDYFTKFVGVPGEVNQQFQLVLGEIVDSVRQGAEALGVLPQDIQQRLNDFVLKTRKISLKGLDAEEQQEEIQAAFSAIFDRLSNAVVPFAKDFQNAGEGIGETIARLATEVGVFEELALSLGESISGITGRSRTAAATGLAARLGGTENFAQAIATLEDNFFTEAEQFEANSRRLKEALDDIPLPDTREGFLDLIRAQDEATKSGRENIATLLRLQGSADQYYDFLEQANGSAEEAARKRAQLEEELLRAHNRTGALIQQQLAGMTDENAALQIGINLRENVVAAEQAVASAEQDLASIYQNQASEASKLADEFKDLTDTIRDAADELFGVGISEPGASRTSFRDTLQRALSGDPEAFEALPQLASDLSDAERSQARTLAESRRASAQIAVELDKAADQAEKEFLTQRSELQVAEKQLEKLTEQELTLRQARDNVAEARTTLKTAQDASTQAISKIGELLPDSIVNGLMEPLSPLEQIDASTQAMVNLLGNLDAGGTVNDTGTGTSGGGVSGGGSSVETADSDLLRAAKIVHESATGGVSTAKFNAAEEAVGGDIYSAVGYTGDPQELKDRFGFADGGIASGPMSGYNATLHGTEAVIPLNGQRIPLEVNNQEMIQELRELRQEVNQLRTEQGQSQYQITKNTKRTRETLEQFDIEGLPPERSAT